MTTWIDLGNTEDFPQHDHTCLSVQGNDLIVFRVDDGFTCMVNTCPHAGLPLGDGDRRGNTITCPYHAYTYHIKTGKNIDFPELEPPAVMLPTRVQGQTLQAQLPDNAAD